MEATGTIGERWFRGRVSARIVWRWVAIGLATGALALLASSDALHAGLLELFDAAREIIARYPIGGAIVFVAFAAAAAMLAFVSSAVLVPAALVAWGPAFTLAMLWLGWILGGASAYVIARYLGRPAAGALVPERALSRYDRWVSPRTPFGLVLLFQLALPSEIPGYVLGFARYSFPRYLLALAVAELPYAAGTVYLGASFLARRTLLLLAVGAAGALVSITAYLALRRRVGPGAHGAALDRDPPKSGGPPASRG